MPASTWSFSLIASWIRTVSLSLCMALICATVTDAAEKTERITIQSIDDQEGTINVVTDSDGQELTLEILRKATIRIDGVDAKRDDLQIGQQATITYDSNLSVVTKIDAAAPEKPKGEIELFNGNDLEGWKFVVAPGAKLELNVLDCWGVDAERGVLFSNGNGPTWLASEQTYDNFILSLEWRFVPNAPLSPNGSGVVVRASGIHSFNLDPRGIEIEIADKHPGNTVEKTTGHFLIYGTPLVTSKGKAAGEKTQLLERLDDPKVKKVGEWNTTEIRCDGERITVKINGKTVNEGTGARVKKGEICLRSQKSAVEFRNVRLIPIEPSALSEDVNPLNGKWIFVDGIAGGVPIEDRDSSRRIVFAGNSYFLSAGDRVIEGTLKFDDKESPCHIDLTPVKGGSPALAGKVQPGIYELKDGGKSLRLSIAPPDSARPTKFDGTAKGASVQTYKKADE